MLFSCLNHAIIQMSCKQDPYIQHLCSKKQKTFLTYFKMFKYKVGTPLPEYPPHHVVQSIDNPKYMEYTLLITLKYV